ncbi:TolC family protein, partial [Desulfuromonas sp.]
MIRILCILLLLLFIALPATPLQAAPLSLRQAERMALERNLELRAATFVSRASDALVRKGFGIYDPRLEVLWTEGESRDLSNFQFFTGQTGVDNRRVDFSLAQTLPTGGELTASMTNRRDHVFAGDEPFLDPEYDSELKLSLVQPLLQGLGRTVTEQTILFAIKDREISVQNLRERGFEILARVRDVYFEVQRQREDLRFRETSVSLAQKVLEEN